MKKWNIENNPAIIIFESTLPVIGYSKFNLKYGFYLLKKYRSINDWIFDVDFKLKYYQL